MSTQTDPNIDPAEAHEHFWPTDPAEAAASIHDLRARLLPQREHRAGEPRRERDSDLEQRLEQALARENELLNRVTEAHSLGWWHAAAQIRSLIEARFMHAPSRELAGLAVADRVAAEAAHRRPVDSAHSIDVRITPGIDGPEYAVHCTALPGAACRRTCAGHFEGRCGVRCADDCDGSLADTGHCLAVLELDNSDGRPIHNGYVGPERALEPGPILVRRDPDGWSWLYAADLPEDVTPQEWTHAQP